MQVYPIRTERKQYRGKKLDEQRKVADYNRVAQLVEDYLNNDMKDKPDDTVNQYLTFHIARGIGEDQNIVHRVVYGIDCGNNGVTIVKGDLDRAMARINGSQRDDPHLPKPSA